MDNPIKQKVEQRKEKRYRYNWPIWFAPDQNDILSQGQMVDISSVGAAFTCYADMCPHTGDRVTARFSVPHHNSHDPFDMESYTRHAEICRIDEISPFIRRVAMQFAEPLPFKPGEETDDDPTTQPDPKQPTEPINDPNLN